MMSCCANFWIAGFQTSFVSDCYGAIFLTSEIASWPFYLPKTPSDMGKCSIGIGV